MGKLSTEQVHKNMAAIHSKDTKQEMIVRKGLCVNDNVKVYQKIIQKYTTSTECCKGTKSLLYITYC